MATLAASRMYYSARESWGETGTCSWKLLGILSASRDCPPNELERDRRGIRAPWNTKIAGAFSTDCVRNSGVPEKRAEENGEIWGNFRLAFIFLVAKLLDSSSL